jgi:large subunit ribosomal protein L16
MPLAPKRVKHRKVQRGREKGFATRDNNIDFGDIALVAMEPTWLNTRIIEAARVAINRKLERKGDVWIRVFPDKPISKKPAEVRMGKGKGAPDHWAAVLKPGMILFEIGGVDLKVAHRALELAASKLPVKTKIAYKPTQDEEE